MRKGMIRIYARIITHTDELKKRFFDTLSSAGISSKDSLESVRIDFSVCAVLCNSDSILRRLKGYRLSALGSASSSSLNIRLRYVCAVLGGEHWFL